MPSFRSAAVPAQLWPWLLAIGLPMLAMSLMGIDSSWDLRNYHLYNPHAWLTGRDAIDIAPAQLQTWHNPLLDVPLYLIVSSGLPGRWASLWLTLPFIVSLILLLRLQALLALSPPTALSQAVLALLALTGAATYSTLGLSTNDGFVAAAMLGSLWLVLSAGQGSVAMRRWLLAGLVAGAMAGLKLTAVIYCIGLAVSALAAADVRTKLRRLGALALGGTLGVALSYGFWGWRLYREHGNPFFPYYNHLFHSPDAAPLPYVDLRFRPDGLWEALLTPVTLLKRSRLFSEASLSDPRLLLGLLALAGLVLLYRKRLPARAVLRERGAILLAFLVTSWLVWALQYGIYRYAIVLELIGALALVLLIQRLPRGRNIALLAAFVLVSADTKRPDWGHEGTNAPMAGIVQPPIPGDAAVVIARDAPLAFVALGLPDKVPLLSVANNFMPAGACDGLQGMASQRLAAHSGPVWSLVTDDDNGASQAVLTRYHGLMPAGECARFGNAMAPVLLCPQRRVAGAVPSCSGGVAGP